MHAGVGSRYNYSKELLGIARVDHIARLRRPRNICEVAVDTRQAVLPLVRVRLTGRELAQLRRNCGSRLECARVAQRRLTGEVSGSTAGAEPGHLGKGTRRVVGGRRRDDDLELVPDIRLGCCVRRLRGTGDCDPLAAGQAFPLVAERERLVLQSTPLVRVRIDGEAFACLHWLRV